MTFKPEKHHRRSIRLKDYDYSQEGYYYATICSQNRECLFGNIVDTKIILNDSGKMLFQVWQDMPKFNPGINMDKFVIMPNHIHGIIRFDVGVDHRVYPKTRSMENDNNYRINGQAQWPAPTTKSISLPDIIKQFKTLTTKKYIDGVRNHSWKPFYKRLWQRNYFEHIIQNDDDLNKIRQYIIDNPFKWSEDEDNPTI